jgi:hypothetical protein
MFLDGLWAGLGRLVPPTGPAACARPVVSMTHLSANPKAFVIGKSNGVRLGIFALLRRSEKSRFGNFGLIQTLTNYALVSFGVAYLTARMHLAGAAA